MNGWKRTRGLATIIMTGAAAIVAASAPAAVRQDRCLDLLAPTAAANAPPRLIEPDDLLRLRSFGRPDNSSSGDSPFGLSPNGQRVALLLRRPDPAANASCQGLVVIDIRKRNVRLVDQGGELIRHTYADLRGLIIPTGTEDIVTPRWSPDGRRLAFLKKMNGRIGIQVAIADHAAGDHATGRFIRLDDDVDAVTWLNARALVFRTSPAIRPALAAIEREGDSGFLYDDRFMPMAANRPFPRSAAATEISVYDLATNRRRAATAAEKAVLGPTWDPTILNAPLRASGANGLVAYTSGSAAGKSDPDLFAHGPDGRTVHCEDVACSALVGLWWSGQTLILMRREGWAKSLTAVYRWNPGQAPPVKVLATPDLLNGCEMLASDLLCGREASLQPRRVVQINVRNGQERLIYDPNPGFSRITLGKAERLQWRNARGIASYGDLVLPPNHKPGERHPLIVVQYRTRGFLRGGTGDEYPIQLFAKRGFAVLSIERPPPVSDEHPDPTWKSWMDAERVNLQNWIDRRNILSTIETGIDLLVARGLVEPGRIGLTGLSDGATTAQYAMINSDRFAAVSLSSCCEDPRTEMIVVGEGAAKELERRGYPEATDLAPDFWRPYSLAMNAERVRTPLLMQLSDDEYAMGLEALTMLKARRRPVEMYVYPGEHHVKWQARHRAAVYERNLDWFGFWLRGEVDPAPAKAAQYARWKVLRADHSSASPPSQP